MGFAALQPRTLEPKSSSPRDDERSQQSTVVPIVQRPLWHCRRRSLQMAFLAAVAEHGTVTQAASLSGVGRFTHYGSKRIQNMCKDLSMRSRILPTPSAKQSGGARWDGKSLWSTASQQRSFQTERLGSLRNEGNCKHPAAGGSSVNRARVLQVDHQVIDGGHC